MFKYTCPHCDDVLLPDEVTCGACGAPVPIRLPESTTKVADAPPGTLRPKAFISYNHRNLEVATRVRDALVLRGCDVTLIDQLLNVSDDKRLAEVLQSSVQQCDLMIVLLTKESLRSEWVGFERVVGEVGLKRIVYVYSGVRFCTSLLKTHFLPHKTATLRVIKRLKARRRYVRLDSRGWDQIVAAHAHRSVEEKRGVRQALSQFFLSYGSLDQMLVTSLFNFCENRLLLRPQSKLWRVSVGACIVLQFTILVGVILFLIGAAWAIVDIYSGRLGW